MILNIDNGIVIDIRQIVQMKHLTTYGTDFKTFFAAVNINVTL